jgi:hypothetical protein
MPAPSDYKAQIYIKSEPAAAPATSMGWWQQQQQQHQGQQRVLGVLDVKPDMRTLKSEPTMLRQQAQPVTADRLPLQPHLSSLMAPAPAANTASGEFTLLGAVPLVAQTKRLPRGRWFGSSGSPAPPPRECPLFGAVSLVAQTERMPERQLLTSSGSPPPPRSSPLPMGGALWLGPRSANQFAKAQPSPPSRPAAKKPRHAAPAAATEAAAAVTWAETEMAQDPAAPRMEPVTAATQLFLQQILAELDAEQGLNPLANTPGPQYPGGLAAPGPLAPAQPGFGPVAGPSPGSVNPAPVSAAAGPVHRHQAGEKSGGSNHLHGKHPGGDLLCGVRTD